MKSVRPRPPFMKINFKKMIFFEVFSSRTGLHPTIPSSYYDDGDDDDDGDDIADGTDNDNGDDHENSVNNVSQGYTWEDSGVHRTQHQGALKGGAWIDSHVRKHNFQALEKNNS